MLLVDWTPVLTVTRDFVDPILCCSGTNRRRAGIVSDIARDDDNELCQKVDFNWVLDQAKTRKGPEDANSPVSSEEL